MLSTFSCNLNTHIQAAVMTKSGFLIFDIRCLEFTPNQKPERFFYLPTSIILRKYIKNDPIFFQI